MAFTGKEGEQITLAEAAAMTKEYRKTITAGATLGHFFGKDIIQSILNQSGPTCVGIRMYYGIDTEGQKQLVLVGVDANENDLYQGVIADRSFKCPPWCGAPNALNSNG